MRVQTLHILRYLSRATREGIRDETNTKETLTAQYAGANWACEFRHRGVYIRSNPYGTPRRLVLTTVVTASTSQRWVSWVHWTHGSWLDMAGYSWPCALPMSALPVALVRLLVRAATNIASGVVETSGWLKALEAIPTASRHGR